jgi:hypothetical protein
MKQDYNASLSWLVLFLLVTLATMMSVIFSFLGTPHLAWFSLHVMWRAGHKWRYIVTVILAGWRTAIAPAREVIVGEGRFFLFFSQIVIFRVRILCCLVCGYHAPNYRLATQRQQSCSLTLHDSVNLLFHTGTAHYTKVSMIM